MTTISAALVKELRERTGAAMMDCKRALELSEGNIDQAIEELRKSGITKADKKSGRIAADGAIAIAKTANTAVMIEVNSETDFVARHQDFRDFVKKLAEISLNQTIVDISSLLKQPIGDQGYTVEEDRQALVAKVGENVQIRRLVHSDKRATTVGTYIHNSRIGAIVELDVDNEALASDIAIHIVASNPKVISPENVDQATIDKEKEIYLAQSASSGKPQDIIDKMVMGRLKKFLDEISLVGQPFVRDPDITIGTLLNKHRAKVLAFYRFEVGEGIEKAVEDFKDAVMSQVR